MHEARRWHRGHESALRRCTESRKVLGLDFFGAKPKLLNPKGLGFAAQGYRFGVQGLGFRIVWSILGCLFLPGGGGGVEHVRRVRLGFRILERQFATGASCGCCRMDACQRVLLQTHT